MKLRILLPALAALTLTSLALAAEKPTVTLHCARPLEPASTFELRFSETMVAADQIGQVAQPSPAVFRPVVKGKFTWLSQRSGTFTPDAALGSVRLTCSRWSPGWRRLTASRSA